MLLPLGLRARNAAKVDELVGLKRFKGIFGMAFTTIPTAESGYEASGPAIAPLFEIRKCRGLRYGSDS